MTVDPSTVPTAAKLKAKVLWTGKTEKKVGLTLKAPTVAGEPYNPEEMTIGTAIDEAQVLHQEKSSSLLLDLKNGHLGFAPISMVYEKYVESFEKRHRIGTIHKCRVVSLNMVDCSPVVSLKESVLDEDFLSYSDLKPGDVVMGHCKEGTSQGMVVEVNHYIQGFCPTLHLTKSRVKNLEKLKSGKKLKYRVLDVDPVRRKMTLTHKKSLVESTLPILSCYEDVRIGDLHHGYIKSVYGWGCVVRFFNFVKGIVIRSDLGVPSNVEPSESFREGQVVVCRVVSCQPEDKKLKLSMEIDKKVDSNPLEPGQMVSLLVEGISPDGITLRSESGEGAFLPALHLSDHVDLCSGILRRHQLSLEEATKSGRPLELEALVVCQKLPMRQALVTCKLSLMESVKDHTLVSDFDQLKSGQVLTGFVKKSESYGVFVEFPGNLVGLCPNKYVKDEFVSNSVGLYTTGQTVRAKVMELDAEKRRIIVNLRCSDLKFSLAGQDWKNVLSKRLKEYLRERMDTLRLKDSLNQHPIGAVREAKVLGFSEDEKLVHLELIDGTPAVTSVATISGDEFEMGQEVKVVVVDVSHPLVVSLSSKLLEAAALPPSATSSSSSSTVKKKLKKQAKKIDPLVPPVQATLSSKVVATVEHLAADHAVCSVTTLNGTGLAYGVFDNGQYGGRPSSMPYLQVGRVLRGVVLELGDEQTYGLPVVVLTGDSTSKHTETDQSMRSYIDHNVGDLVDALVVSVSDVQVDVRCGTLKGRIHISMATDVCTDGESPLSKYKPNDIIKARILKIRKSPGRPAILELCTKESAVSNDLEDFTEDKCSSTLNPSLKKGQRCIGVINKITNKGLVVHLSPTSTGHIPSELVSQDVNVVEALNLYYTEGQAVQCEVVEENSQHKYRMPKLSLIGIPDPPKVGDVVVAKVTRVEPNQGLTVSIATFYIGRIHITDLSDSYKKNPTSRFQNGDFLKCVVIDHKEHHYTLSLRPSRMDDGATPTDVEVMGIKDVSENALMRGYVKAATKRGIFVWIGRELCGRIKFGNLTDGYVDKPMEHFSPGELIKFKVLSVNTQENQIELSTRGSHVSPKAFKKLKKRATEGHKKSKKQKDELAERVLLAASDSDEEDVVDDSGVESVVGDDGDGDGDGGDGSDGDEMMIQGVGPRLEVGEFKWDMMETDDLEGDHDHADDSDEDEESTPQVSSKTSKRQKKAAKRLEEQKLYEMELANLDINRPLETADDYERLVVTSPDSSSAWIHYILFHLTAAEVEKAKAVAQRALSTISYNKENEKLNVWVALLNLENMYGTQQSLNGVFQSALQQNDPGKVYWKMIAIYKKSDKLEMADELFKTMMKKFGSDLKVWIGYAEFMMGRGHLEAARRLLEKSFKSLPKAHHVDMIVKFAEFEYKIGDPSRGQTLFENVVSNYPKRLDVWSRYFDMSIKQGDRESTRMLFERAIQLHLSAKKMKFFFNRYLDFERHHGTVASVAAVREKAGEFVDRKTQIL
jgi:rRNA biogenesis protein RRP5